MSLIPKKIHVSWIDKNLLNSNSIFVKECIGNVISLATDWHYEISTDIEINNYLKEHLSSLDYNLISNKHIIEKCDLWRLIKLYNEGGMYVDIDRLCNISINELIDENTKLILPTCLDYDFSQDFMCSAPENPIFNETIKLNLLRRREGHNNVYLLGPQTYFDGITMAMFGKIFEPNERTDVIKNVRNMINETNFIKTYREFPPYDTVLFKRKKITNEIFDHENEKRKFYSQSGLKHWSGEW
jgi:hypothetical protein